MYAVQDHGQPTALARGQLGGATTCGTDAAAVSLSPNVIGGDCHHPTRDNDYNVDVIYLSIRVRLLRWMAWTSFQACAFGVPDSLPTPV